MATNIMKKQTPSTHNNCNDIWCKIILENFTTNKMRWNFECFAIGSVELKFRFGCFSRLSNESSVLTYFQHGQRIVTSVSSLHTTMLLLQCL